MIIRKGIDIQKQLTDEQEQMLEEAKSRPVTPDADIPELTDEQIRLLHPRRNSYAARLKAWNEAKEESEYYKKHSCKNS